MGVEWPCYSFLVLNSMQGYRTLQSWFVEVWENDSTMEGSLYYLLVLSLVYSNLVTSFILDVGRGVGMLLHFLIPWWCVVGLLRTAVGLWMSERKICAWMLISRVVSNSLNDPPSLQASGCNTVCRAKSGSVKMWGWSGLVVFYLLWTIHSELVWIRVI